MASRYHFRDVPSFGEKLGSSLGAGLGGGLAALAESKLNTLLSRNQREEDKRRLVSLGMPEEEANYVSTLDADKQWQYAHRYLITKGSPEEIIFPASLDEDLRITPEMNQQAEEQIRAMGIELPGEQPNAAQLLTQQTPMSDIMRNQLEKTQIQQPKSALQALQPEPVQAAPQPQVAQMPEQLKGKEQLALAANKAPSRIPEPPKEEIKLPERKVKSPEKKTRSVAEVFKQAAGTLGAGNLTQKDLAKLHSEQRKELTKAQAEANKETKAYYDDVLDSSKSAHHNDIRLKRMEHLIEKGSLPVAAFYNLWSSLEESEAPGKIPVVGGVLNAITHGIGWAAKSIQKNITSRDTEEFEKLSNDFVRDAKSIFGARITDQDLRTFMQMVPTLAQTDNGKKHIIRNMKLFNEAAQDEARVMKEIIKENGGVRPFDLRERVEERLKVKKNDLAEKFISGALI